MSDGNSSHKISLLLISKIAAKLKEKHDGVFKQASPHSLTL